MTAAIVPGVSHHDLGWPRRLLNTGHMAALAAVERRIPYWPMERIQRLQDRRLQAIVRHAYETVPYYRCTMDELGLRPGDFATVADLDRLPLIDAAMVRQDPARFASTAYDDRTRRAFYSSGNLTHVPKTIYWDYASVLRKLARAERDRVVLAALSGQSWRRRQLHIYPPMGTVPAVMAIWDAQTWVSRRLVERHSLSAEQPFEAVVATMNAVEPHLAFSYGSYADHFFRYLADRGVAAAVPRVWRYGGDMLSPGGKELIEGRFGCKVHSTYQAAETGRIGYQCERRQGFHLNIDFCAVRVVNGAGREAPPGQQGEIVASNLHNRAMVLLNYRIGDWGTMGTGECPCGRSLPLLERLEGRESEVVALADGRVLPYGVMGTLFRQELDASLKAQIVQSSPGQVAWRIVPFAGADREVMRRALIVRGRDVLGEATSVEVEFVADIPPTAAGKFSRVVTAEGAGD